MVLEGSLYPVIRCRNETGFSTGPPPRTTPEMTRLILASASSIRRKMLVDSGVTVEALPARIDEESIRAAMQAEGAKPRDLADTLAEMKARKLSERHPDAVVIGSDQVLNSKGKSGENQKRLMKHGHSYRGFVARHTS